MLQLPGSEDNEIPEIIYGVPTAAAPPGYGPRRVPRHSGGFRGGGGASLLPPLISNVFFLGKIGNETYFVTNLTVVSKGFSFKVLRDSKI